MDPLKPPAPTRRRMLAAGLALVSVLASAPTVASASGPAWQSYVLGPASARVNAVRAEGRGAVTHPDALVRRHRGPTTLTTVAGGTPASVLLDFGRDTAGTPTLDIAKLTTPATLSLITGEARQYLRHGGVNRATASLVHGWAAAPTVQLTQQVLGVTPVGAGYSTWLVKPHPGSLAWARGAVPTPYGSIVAGWRSAGDRFDLRVAAPRTTAGTIAVPAGTHSRILVDSRPVWTAITDGYAELPLPGGSHFVTVLSR